MSNNVVVCALYKFAVLNDYKSLRQPLLDLMLEKDVHGTLLLALVPAAERALMP